MDQLGFKLRPQPLDLLRLCYEMQGGPAERLDTLALRRVADVWRANGHLERGHRILATIKAANAESPTLWTEIIEARGKQHQYEEAQAELYFAELRQAIDSAPTEALRKMRRKHLAEERRAYLGHYLRNLIDDPYSHLAKDHTS